MEDATDATVVHDGAEDQQSAEEALALEEEDHQRWTHEATDTGTSCCNTEGDATCLLEIFPDHDQRLSLDETDIFTGNYTNRLNRQVHCNSCKLPTYGSETFV